VCVWGGGGVKIIAMTVKMGNLYSRTLTVMFLPFLCIFFFEQPAGPVAPSLGSHIYGHVCGNCPCAIFVFR